MDRIRSYKITDAAGVGKFLAVIRGTNAGEAKKPTAADEAGCVGITQEEQATQNRSVAVMTEGFTFAVAKSAIGYGDAVGIAGTDGKLKSVQTAMLAAPGTPAVVNVVGYAETPAANENDIFVLRIAIFTVKTAAS